MLSHIWWCGIHVYVWCHHSVPLHLLCPHVQVACRAVPHALAGQPGLGRLHQALWHSMPSAFPVSDLLRQGRLFTRWLACDLLTVSPLCNLIGCVSGCFGHCPPSHGSLAPLHRVAFGPALGLPPAPAPPSPAPSSPSSPPLCPGEVG